MSSKIPHLSLAPPALADGQVVDERPRAGARARRLLALRRVGVYALALGVLALVFLSYFDPNLMFALATQVWSCL